MWLFYEVENKDTDGFLPNWKVGTNLMFDTKISVYDDFTNGNTQKYVDFVNAKLMAKDFKWKHADCSLTPDLQKSIVQQASEYARFHGFEYPLKIRTMWINTVEKGFSLPRHSHDKEATVSGIFYIAVGENDNIEFWHPDANDPISIKCKADRLILFPSSLPHSTHLRIDDQLKICFAVNLELDR